MEGAWSQLPRHGRGGGAVVSRAWRTQAAGGSWGLNKKKDEGAELFFVRRSVTQRRAVHCAKPKQHTAIFLG